MAYALATRLLRAVKASGLPFTKVAGWKTRGRGTMGRIQTVTLHHTATPRSYMKSNDIPTLNVLKNGRGSLPGPLCHIGLGRSGHVYLVAAGIANHAGRSRATSMTNPHAIGIEAEGALEAWPAEQMRAYVLLVAALLSEFGLANGRALRHAETCSPPGRKIDASFDGPTFRKAVANSKPGHTPAPTPVKGFFGMSGYEQTTRTGDKNQQTIPAGARARLRLQNPTKNHAGPHYIARPTRKGQKFLLQADASFQRIPEGGDVKAQIVICYYLKGGGHIINRPFEQVSVPDGINGWSSVSVSQVEQFGGTPPGSKRDGKEVSSVEYQFEIANFSTQSIVAKRTRRAAFYDK